MQNFISITSYMYDFTLIESGSRHFVQSITKMLTEPNNFFFSKTIWVQQRRINADLKTAESCQKVHTKYVQQIIL
jgi:hypothetical protein